MGRCLVVVAADRPGFRTRLFRVSLLGRVLDELALLGEREARVVSEVALDEVRGAVAGELLPRIAVAFEQAPAGGTALARVLALAAGREGESIILPADRLYSRPFLAAVLATPADPARILRLTAAAGGTDPNGAVLKLSGGGARTADAPPREVGLPGFATPVATRGQERLARAELLDGLRKPLYVDGLICHFLMRPLTLRITRFLARTPVTPNQLTLLALTIGLGGSALVACGGRREAVLGAFLYFAAGYVDCLDGEIARVNYLMSLRGAWLDTVSDDLQTIGFVAAVGWHLLRAGSHPALAAAAFAGAAIFALAQAYLYRRLVAIGSGDLGDFHFAWEKPRARAPGAAAGDLVNYVMRRDFFTFLFFLLFAAGVPAAIPVLFLAATVGFGGALAAHIAVVARRRGAP